MEEPGHGGIVEIFLSAGAGAFAERARIELRATGERAPKRTAQTRAALTAREAHIARLAGQGVSNAEIAAQLYVSPATVAYHLRKVFAALGISSRSQLASALPAQPDSARAGPATGLRAPWARPSCDGRPRCRRRSVQAWLTSTPS